MSEHSYRPNWLSRIYSAVGTVAAAIARDARLLMPGYRQAFPNTPLWFVALVAAVAPIWGWLLIEAMSDIWIVTTGLPQADNTKEAVSANRERAQSILFGIGIIGALLAVIIVPIRLWLQNRQTITAEQGHITDRLNKAIEMLGTEKTTKYLARRIISSTENDGQKNARHQIYQRIDEVVETPKYAKDHDISDWESIDETLPNLEVRLGAIYALERIARDSERDHITVMETLCAYARENAPGGSCRRA